MVTQMTRGEYEEKYGKKPNVPTQAISTSSKNIQSQPKQNKGFLEKASDIANIASFGVGRKTGEAIGTAAGALYTKGKDLLRGTNNYANYDITAPSPVQVGADVAAGALNIAGLKGLSPSGSLLKQSAKEFALDAGAGAATEIAQKGKDATAGGVAKQAALWGGVGAALPGAIKVGGSAINALKPSVRAAKNSAKAVEEVTEKIMPKPTAKEARLATSQGRFMEGKKPTLFRSGTEDKILPTQKVKSASQIIVDRIPGAQKMSPTELYRSVEGEIGKSAKQLKPKLQAVPLREETLTKINNSWNDIKKSQIELADATQEANVLKLQKQFESRLQKSKSNNYDDLWETRIEYDKSIPDNVKKANALSPENLQMKKDMWLQNRQILSDAIEDVAPGLDDVTRKSFSDMSNLYEAKNNILSKAKVNKEQASKIKQFMEKNPAITTALKGAGIYAVLKELGIPLP